MKLEIPDYVNELMNELNYSGYECYVVGGAVRSLLLGLPVHDYDLTTNALPEQMQKVFVHYKTIETGIKHGTLTVLSHHHPIEITTYRKDAAYQDHRHPDAVTFTSAIQEDCARRDFTINAFCYNETDGLLDFFHGKEDLDAKILRCIGDPEKRFEEDALRILRAIRFAARLHFTMEEKTEQALFKKKELLSYVSIERIHDEMDGLLQADACGGYLDTYKEIFALFLPEINAVTAWNDVIAKIDAAPADPVIRMAVVLTYCSDPAGVLKRMKYSNESTREILDCIKYQKEPLLDTIALRKFISVYPSAVQDYFQYRKAVDPSFDASALYKEYEQILKRHDCITLSQLELKGNDVSALGYQGKEIAEVLQKLLTAVMEEKVPNKKAELTAYIKSED